jgi:hypothetical protein
MDAVNENGLVHDLKKRAAQIPAEHVRTFVEFLAHNAELFGLLPDQTAEGTKALDALFGTFIPEQQRNVDGSHELFDDLVDQIDAYKANAVDGDQDAAERCLDLDLRILVPPRRSVVVKVDEGTGDFLADIRLERVS